MSDQRRKRFKSRQKNGSTQLMSMSNPVQEAMSNEMILQFIFTHLRTPHLLRSCRLVNKKWNCVATGALKQRSDAYVKVNAKTDLRALTACIKNSPDFPFREIDLNVSDEDFGKSPGKWLDLGIFLHYSSAFTRLRLGLRMKEPDTVADSLLSGPFNHIQSLTLTAVGVREKNARQGNTRFLNGDNRFNLRKLKTITMDYNSDCVDVDLPFLAALLQSCPNLQRADYFTNAHLRAISAAGKLGSVKSLRLCSCVYNDSNCPWPSKVETLITVKGEHVDGVTFDDLYLDYDSVQPILKSSRKTIRRIVVFCGVYYGERSHWPKLSKLTSLRLYEDFCFPASSVNEIFPALKKISALFHPVVDMCKEPLESVTTLEVLPCLDKQEWARMSETMPNVRNIFVNYDRVDDCCTSKDYDYEKDIATGPWAGLSCFKQLETLCISPIELLELNLDKFFTGILDPVLENLQANPRLAVPTPKFIDLALRGTKSVASLPGLRELVVRFAMADRATKHDVQTKRPISHVTTQYGFNSASADLKIQFMYDHSSKNVHLIRKALRSVHENVTIGHWDVDPDWEPKLDFKFESHKALVSYFRKGCSNE